MRNGRRGGGYSLLELIMTTALAALVLGLGVPSFASLTADKRLRVEIDALFHAVHHARKESITRRRVVTLCPSVDGEYCDPDDRWSAGWIMFANHSRVGAGRRDEREVLIRHHAVGEDVIIRSNRSSYSFRATRLRATNGTVVFCHRGGRAEPRALVVSYTGRPRVARQDRRGRPYRCAD